MAEPLVDMVEPDQMATDAVCVLTLDLNTVTKAEASYRVCRTLSMCSLHLAALFAACPS